MPIFIFLFFSLLGLTFGKCPQKRAELLSWIFCAGTTSGGHVCVSDGPQRQHRKPGAESTTSGASATLVVAGGVGHAPLSAAVEQPRVWHAAQATSLQWKLRG
jgi:hypothetical protein